MIKVSCQIDPDLDQLNPVNAKQIVVDTCEYQNVLECDITLIFVSDEYLSELKTKYFQKNHFTDVIAFRLNEYEEIFVEGEVYISLPRAKENSEIFNQPYAKEVSRLIAHGCLHLIGLKDESKFERDVMRNKEEDILKNNNWKDIFKV
ncbi:MAG: rRNA maturation RNase YbeY [Candidatus Neomarinimicrobiota bacterium]